MVQTLGNIVIACRKPSERRELKHDKRIGKKKQQHQLCSYVARWNVFQGNAVSLRGTNSSSVHIKNNKNNTLEKQRLSGLDIMNLCIVHSTISFTISNRLLHEITICLYSTHNLESKSHPNSALVPFFVSELVCLECKRPDKIRLVHNFKRPNNYDVFTKHIWFTDS